MITVTVDKREKQSRRELIEDRFSTFKDVKVKEDTLPVGDYLVSRDSDVLFCIEWKTYSDLVSSIMNGHIQSQLEDMDKYEHPYLFVTGNYKQWISKSHNRDIHISKQQIDGFVTSVAGRHKTRLIMYDSEGDAINGIIKLIAIHGNDEVDHNFKMPERVKRTGDVHADMLLCIPGLGMKKVKELRDADITFSQFMVLCRVHEGDDSPVYIDGIRINKNIVEYVRKL